MKVTPTNKLIPEAWSPVALHTQLSDKNAVFSYGASLSLRLKITKHIFGVFAIFIHMTVEHVPYILEVIYILCCK